ncbi:MAG: hypothetical protein ABI839_01890 [Verrucomicrobiota bacterium]
MKKRLLVCALLVLLAFGAHAPALRGGFVWDDTALILRDPLIRSWRLIPEQFQHFLFTDATPSNFYRPVQRITYTFEYWAAIFQPALFHLTNILLHAGAAIALFIFALALMRIYGVEGRRRECVAILAAAAWALHPLHSAVVDYVSGRADSLAALFGFVGLYFCVRTLEAEGREAWRFHGCTGAAFLLSALSKESGLIFCLAAFGLVVARRQWRTLRGLAISLAFVVTIYGTLRVQAEVIEIPQMSAPIPFLVRPIIAARALAEYAGLLVAPVRLHMDRDVESHPAGMNNASMTAVSMRELEGVAGCALVLLLGWWMLRARRAEPAVFALLLLGAIFYAPVSGLLPLNASIAEHWLYVPSAFLLLAVALQLSRLRSQLLLRGVIVGSCLWMLALGGRSFVRAGDWNNQRTFLERNIAAGGDSARMLINLAALEMSGNRLDLASDLFRRALAREPGQPLASLNLAAVELRKNEFAAARADLARATAHPATEALAHNLRATLDYKEHAKLDLMRLRLATRTAPPNWSIERRYVRVLWDTGHRAAAIAELKGILRTDAYRAESWQILAVYLVHSGHPKEGVDALSLACDLDVHLGEHEQL